MITGVDRIHERKDCLIVEPHGTGGPRHPYQRFIIPLMLWESFLKP
jgi:hypothetical protein